MIIGLFAVRILLAITFAIAGVAKLFDQSGSRKSLRDFGLATFLARPLAVLLPVMELVCAAALIPNTSVRWGAVGVVVLLTLFIVGINVSLARGRKPDCHCFGQLSSEPVGAKTLVRNTILLALASLVAWKGGDDPASIRFGSYTGLETTLIAVAAVLAAGLVLILWLLFHMLRQNGRLLLRLEAVEAKLNIDAEATPVLGLPVGTPAPDFFLKSLDGNTVTLGALRESGKPVLLVFSGPECSACEALLPQLANWQSEHGERLKIALISEGDIETNRAKHAKLGIRDVLLQSDPEVSESYLVPGTPSAVLIVNGVVDSPLATGQDEIQALIHRATLPPRVEKGDLVPALRLRDLSGETVDFASFQGRRTMVLFWSPSCGYCEQMLDDVKKWERSRPKEAPELLIISSGSPEDNRAQGFRSQVLLDQNFGAGTVLGLSGTPSAVLVDENGRIASDVSVGAVEVMALAGATPQKTAIS